MQIKTIIKFIHKWKGEDLLGWEMIVVWKNRRNSKLCFCLLHTHLDTQAHVFLFI